MQWSFFLKKQFKTLLTFFSFLTLLLLLVEIALYAREKRLSTPDVIGPNGSNNQISVLVLGDSVMGSEQNSNSLIYNIKNYLQMKLGSRLRIINQSQPALSFWQAQEKIDQYISTFRPQIALIMLGNSDFVIQKDSDRFYAKENILNALLKLRSFRIAYRYLQFLQNREIDNKIPRGQNRISPNIAIKFEQIKSCIPQNINEGKAKYFFKTTTDCLYTRYPDLKRSEIWHILGVILEKNGKLDLAIESYQKSIKLETHKISSLKNLFYVYFMKGDYNNALDIFEELARLKIVNRRLMSVAQNIYLQQNKNTRGAIAFENIQKQNSIDSHLRLHAGMLASATSLIENPSKFQGNEVTQVKTRDEYIDTLFRLKIVDQKEKANELYKKLNEYDLLEDQIPDINSIVLINEKLYKSNIRSILTQYPNQPIWPIKLATDLLNFPIFLIDLHEKVQPQLSEHAVYNFFQNDLLHVSDLGAKVFGKIIAEEIYQFIRKSGMQ